MESSAADAEDSAEFDAWCLTRVGSNVDWLYLMDNTEITVGRGLDVMYQLISPTCPLMISRLHCVFRQQGDGHWTVTDKKSLNGVWLNGQRIPAERAHPLQLGDAVHLGVAVAGAKVEYQYIFVRRPLKDVKPHLARVTTPAVTNAAKRKFGLDETEPSTSSKPKLYRSSTPDTSGARPCPAPVAAVAAILISDDSDSSGDLDNLQMFNQNMIALWEHFSDAQKRVATLEGASQQGSPAATEAQVRELKGQLAALLVKIRHMETLGMSFSQTKRQLVGLKPQKMKQEEEVFKKQVVEALQEQSKVTLELAQFRQGFKERFLAKKEELEVTREKNEKARAQKEEVVTQMMENDNLQCVICSELFIQPYMLNCSHIFCLHCIGKWRKRKDECPICRQTIHSQTRCLPLDNFIDSMVETLCADAKARRQVLVAERKAKAPDQVTLILDSNATSSSSASSSASSSSSSSSSLSTSGSDLDSDEDYEEVVVVIEEEVVVVEVVETVGSADGSSVRLDSSALTLDTGGEGGSGSSILDSGSPTSYLTSDDDDDVVYSW